MRRHALVFGAASAVALVFGTLSWSGPAGADELPRLPPPPSPALPAPEPVPEPVPQQAPKASAPPLSAAAERTPDPRPAAPVERWYGWQTLTLDGINFLVLIPVSFGIASHGGSAEFIGASGAALGILGYAVGAPIIHAVHGEFRMSALSFGLRTVAPLGTAFVGGALGGFSAAGSGSERASLALSAGVLSGAFIGAAGAIAIDAVFGTTIEQAPKSPQVSFGVTPGGAALHGRF